MKSEQEKDYRRKMEKVTQYVVRNPSADLSLEVLSEMVNYSPFHFQKVFKKCTGESPKQYVMRMRLETAAHYLIIHPRKTVTEIALDCGFSSAAVFARSFKLHYGMPAEKFRNAPPGKRSLSPTASSHLKKILDNHEKKTAKKKLQVKIEVKKLPPAEGIYLITEFNNLEGIKKSLRDIVAKAKAHDLFTENSKVMGVMYPHHNVYKALVTIEPGVKIPYQINKTEIAGGKFATFRLRANIHEAFQKITFFYHQWLPQNGYKVADIYGFELFSEIPSEKSYEITEREIHLPIEPV